MTGGLEKAGSRLTGNRCGPPRTRCQLRVQAEPPHRGAKTPRPALRTPEAPLGVIANPGNATRARAREAEPSNRILQA